MNLCIPRALTTALTNTTSKFNVTVSDPDQNQVDILWSVDNNPQSVGSSFDYQPTFSDLGMHIVQVNATDQASNPESTVFRWTVMVVLPDVDLDGWRANVDCDDNNPNINPGMREIFYNGINDDCSSASIDTDSPPIANNQSLQIFQFSPIDIILTGNDVDGYPLNFSITNQPNNGSLSEITIIDPTNARLTYNPTSNFHGEDKFAFTVNDGNYTSNPASVNITVVIQDPPVAPGSKSGYRRGYI